MNLLNQRRHGTGGNGRRWHCLVLFGFASAALSTGLASGLSAQTKDEKPNAESAAPSAADNSADERLKAVERERDELKKRNADLEQRLKQLQASVDDQVHQALGEAAASATPGFAVPPSAGTYPRRLSGPYFSQFRPIFSPFSGSPDPIELAVAFSDALGEKEAAKPALEGARQKLTTGRGVTTFDVEAATAQLQRAQRKVQLLRKIITTARAVAADEAERLRGLGAVRAVSMAEVRNADARLKILDEILASDPEAPPKPTSPQP